VSEGGIFAAAVAAVLMAVQLASVALATWRLRAARTKRNAASPSVTLLVPVRGLDPFAQRTLGSAFRQDYDNYEIVFTVASPADPEGGRGFSSARTI
jgi:ceramide glucosyltransferase